jgi:hypothetical protein
MCRSQTSDFVLPPKQSTLLHAGSTKEVNCRVSITVTMAWLVLKYDQKLNFVAEISFLGDPPHIRPMNGTTETHTLQWWQHCSDQEYPSHVPGAPSRFNLFFWLVSLFLDRGAASAPVWACPPLSRNIKTFPPNLPICLIFLLNTNEQIHHTPQSCLYRPFSLPPDFIPFSSTYAKLKEDILWSLIPLSLCNNK